MRLVLLAIIALALPGCVGPLGPPDTFDDMWQQLDSLAVPTNFTLIAKEKRGVRDVFIPAGEPGAANLYSVRWDETALCEQLRQILADDRKAVTAKRYGKACVYVTTISAGWKAKLVNVWSYKLAAHAAPDASPKGPTPSECAEIRRRHEQAYGPNDYFRGMPECWVEPGHALVRIDLEGKRGWW